ncbi:MAG: protein kinase, partial [Anaerolineae bacterium]|nr:protein kinase [Anaerolineae bacterium]
VALKVLQADTSPQNEMSLERFQREARAIARLNHPNIVGIYQFGQAEDVYYIAMEFIKGVDLWQELRQLRQSQQMISVEYALGIMDQMASALDYAHLQGIIHRDVKPSNIMLAKDQAVLTNFGLVLFQAEGSMGNTFGTPRYISPEQAISSNQALPQSDIYSLAVVLYECLVGETPFAGDSPMEIALSHITEPAPIPSSRNNAIPQAVDAALLKALDKDPKARFESATSFIHAVRGGYSLSPQSPLSPSRSTSTDTQPMRAVNVTSSAPSKSVPGASHATTTPPIRKTAPPAPRPQPARTGMPVFVSYSSKNATERAQVVDELVKLDTVKRDEAHEKGVWFDDGLKQHGGQEWWDLILGQVVNRDLFVFVLTSESLLSFACYLEYT